MPFRTLLLVIFVSESILDGVIWDVPWPLVALMGFSQAGYLAPKLTSQHARRIHLTGITCRVYREGSFDLEGFTTRRLIFRLRKILRGQNGDKDRKTR